MATEHFPSIGSAALDTDAEISPVETIESLCMECHEQGITRLLLTYIPYFKEVIVISFRCEHCGLFFPFFFFLAFK